MAVLVTASVLTAHAATGTASNPESTGGSAASTKPHAVKPFRGLGAWVDTYDVARIHDPAARVADMKQHGVRTLYLGTSRSGLNRDIAYPARIDAWLNSAHRAGIRVAGWYVPDYRRPARELRRTLAIGRHATRDGRGFDAIGIDIEFRPDGMPVETWNRRVAAHLHRVDARTEHAIGAIVMPPQYTRLRPELWSDFPWRAVSRHADVVLPMSYWTQLTPRERCPSRPGFCVHGYTKRNTKRAHELTGLPVHTIGGIGNQSTRKEITSYVAALGGSGSVGGSLYDYLTTKDEFWSPLRRVGSQRR